jgi:hypothetical protein
MSASKAVRKFFLCTGECVPADKLADYPGSHIIGELRYVVDEGQRIGALAVYESSLPSGATPPVMIEIRAEIIGDARRIKCTILHCKHVKRWEIGRTTFIQLQQRYRKAI